MIRRWPTLIIALLLLLPSPALLFAIFLSGDSCCGENTSGTMAAVTAVCIAFSFMIACSMHGLFRLMRREQGEGYAVIRSSLVSTIPIALLYAGFLLFLTAQWLF